MSSGREPERCLWQRKRRCSECRGRQGASPLRRAPLTPGTTNGSSFLLRCPISSSAAMRLRQLSTVVLRAANPKYLCLPGASIPQQIGGRASARSEGVTPPPLRGAPSKRGPNKPPSPREVPRRGGGSLSPINVISVPVGAVNNRPYGFCGKTPHPPLTRSPFPSRGRLFARSLRAEPRALPGALGSGCFLRTESAFPHAVLYFVVKNHLNHFSTFFGTFILDSPAEIKEPTG